jgi:hypothetical protein
MNASFCGASPYRAGLDSSGKLFHVNFLSFRMEFYYGYQWASMKFLDSAYTSIGSAHGWRGGGASRYPPAKPVALACEPLKAAGKAFSASASVSQSEVAIGF